MREVFPTPESPITTTLAKDFLSPAVAGLELADDSIIIIYLQ
jgi:hypothetical protein